MYLCSWRSQNPPSPKQQRCPLPSYNKLLKYNNLFIENIFSNSLNVVIIIIIKKKEYAPICNITLKL